MDSGQSLAGLRRLQHQIRYRLAIALLGRSAAARARFAEFLESDSRYKGPITRIRGRTLIACGDHHVWALAGDTGVGQGLLKHGAWQRDDFDAALRLILQRNNTVGSVFVDVGANIGTQSLYAALCGHFRRLVAIEPEARNANLLRENLALNDIAIPFDVVQKAVGSSKGLTHLTLHETDSGMHSIAEARSEQSIAVEQDTLPNILAGLEIAPGDIGLIWMDIEGRELDVLAVADDFLRVRTPLFFEHGRSRVADPAYWAKKFTSCGYDCWVVRHGRAERTAIHDALQIDFGNLLLI